MVLTQGTATEKAKEGLGVSYEKRQIQDAKEH
jgi:hypothetical protein